MYNTAGAGNRCWPTSPSIPPTHMTHPLKRLCVRIDKSTTTPALFSYFFPLIELTVVTLFAMSAHVPPPRLVLFIPFRLDVLNSNLTFFFLFFFFFPPVIFWSFSLSLPPTYTQQLTDEQSYRRRHSSLPMQKFLFFHVWPSANASLLIWRISERCTPSTHKDTSAAADVLKKFSDAPNSKCEPQLTSTLMRSTCVQRDGQTNGFSTCVLKYTYKSRTNRYTVTT